MTKDQRRVVKTGIVFTIITFIVIRGVNYIKSNDLLTNKTVLYGVYDNVKELSVGNHVYISGTKVGKIVNVDFIKGNLNKLVVEFHIRKGIKIPDSTIAMITSTDIMGTMGLELIINNRTKKHYKSGDTLQTKVASSISEEVNKQIMPLKLKTESMLATLDSLLVAFRAVFNPKTRKNINLSFERIQHTLKYLESASNKLDNLMTSEGKRLTQILKNAESITKNIENNNENINKILGNFGEISDSLAASNLINVIHKADNSITKLSEIMDKIEKGEGTLGLLLEDEELYNNLDKASKDLDKLLIDIKENPKRYVRFSAFNFGKKIIVNDTDSISEK